MPLRPPVAEGLRAKEGRQNRDHSSASGKAERRGRPRVLRSLRDAIRSGRLSAGERLPSSRQMAQELGVSRGLVLECYTQLQAEGYLSAHDGSATRVAAGAQRAPALTPSAPVTKRLAIDFRPGCPDLSSFPRRDWMWALRDVHRTAPAEALDYGDPHGSLRLREVLASYLRRVRGAVADPESIVVCTGFAQGVNLLLRVLGSRGVRVLALEDPGDVDPGTVARRLCQPPELVLGFGDLTQSSIERGITTIADLLRG